MLLSACYQLVPVRLGFTGHTTVGTKSHPWWNTTLEKAPMFVVMTMKECSFTCEYHARSHQRMHDFIVLDNYDTTLENGTYIDDIDNGV